MTAALSLNSCDNRMGSDMSDGFSFSATAVSYNGSVGTKATPINTVDAFESTYTSFTVSAYKGAAAKFTEGTSTYSSGEWNLTATDAKWWPNESLDFYALAFPETTPSMITLADEMVVIPSTKTAVFDYTFSLDSATGENTPDIMFGYYSGQGTVSGNKRVAPLTFYHPFAAIKFKAGADLVGATVNSITIKNVAYSGTCTIAASNLATAGNSAISWQTNTGLADYGDTYAVAVTAENQQIGTDAQTFMIVPQTMGETAKLEVNLTVEANGVNKTVTLEASLNNLAFTAGTIHTFTINYDTIPLDFTEPNAAIIAYVPDGGTHIDDPTLVPKYAYMPTGQAFNAAIKGLVGERAFTKIVFNRFGAVDDGALEIQAASPVGEPIYAQYEEGIVTITTHANTIYLNADCSYMFQDMNTITEISWGSFFETEAVAEVKGMFMGCSSMTVINLNDVFVNLNTNVTDMSHMFDGCSAASYVTLGRLSGNNVTDMSFMYRDCSSSTSLPAFENNTNNPNRQYQFYNCSSLFSVNLNYAGSNMDYMFYGCSGLEWFNTYTTFVIDSPDITAYHMFENAFNPTASEGNFSLISHATYDWLMDPVNNTCLVIPSGIHIHFQ